MDRPADIQRVVRSLILGGYAWRLTWNHGWIKVS